MKHAFTRPLSPAYLDSHSQAFIGAGLGCFVSCVALTRILPALLQAQWQQSTHCNPAVRAPSIEQLREETRALGDVWRDPAVKATTALHGQPWPVLFNAAEAIDR